MAGAVAVRPPGAASALLEERAGATKRTQATLQTAPATQRMTSGCQWAATTSSRIVATAETTRKSSAAPEMRSICTRSTSRSILATFAKRERMTPPTMQSGKSGKPLIGMQRWMP